MINEHLFLLYCFQFYIFLKKKYGCNTIDMTSICSQTNIERNIIQFPKKTVIQNNNNTFINNNAVNYDVYPATDRFDPNISSSPPNAFVDILKQRMNMYYINDNTSGTNNIINKFARNRTLSWEHK
jgi:hypothetical protein